MVVIAAAGLGIRVLDPPSGRSQKTGSLTVCAARIAASAKRPVVPTPGYRGRPPAADLLSIGPAALVTSPAAASAAATPRGGEKCGLVVAYGPVHTLAWVLGMNRRDATWKDFATRVAFLFIVAMLGAALLAAAWKPDSRLKSLMFAWVDVLLVTMAAGPRKCDTPRRRWWVTCCDALAAVYGPFVVAGVNTWLFDGFNTWMKVEFWKYLVLVPGGVIMELISVAIWHRHPGLPSAIMFALSGLLSAMVVIVTTWLAVNVRWTRWLVLPLICGLCGFGRWPWMR